jgi:hypothetical protein
VEKLERGHDRTASVIEVLVEDFDRLAHDVRQMKTLPVLAKHKIGFDLSPSRAAFHNQRRSKPALSKERRRVDSGILKWVLRHIW